MKTNKLFVATAIFAAASQITLAQHGGHPSGTGNVGHNQSAVDPQRVEKIQATEQQRAQLADCFASAERLRILAAESRNLANLSRTELEGIRRWSELQHRSMESDHEAFLRSLNADQQATLKGSLRKMEKIRFELAGRLEATTRDLTETVPDARLLVGDAKDLERSLKQWEKQHRALGREMGVAG